MRVAVVYERMRPEERQIIEAIREMGHEAVPYHLNSSPLSFEGEYELDVVIIRAISSTRAQVTASLFEGLGVRVVNSSRVLSTCGNKVMTTSALVKAGVPTPRTKLAFNLEGALKAAESLGYPVVVKPINGSWGRLVSLAEDEEELRTIIEHREAIPSPYYRVHYIQEYVRKPGRDLRVYATEERVVAAIYRVSDHWITNTARGGRAEPAEITEEIEDISVKAVRAVGGGFLGIDLVESEEGLKVLELNGVTEFKNASRVTGVDIARELVRYALGGF